MHGAKREREKRQGAADAPPGRSWHEATDGGVSRPSRCGAYRYDETKRRRYTTVEVIVEERPWVPERHCSDPDRMVGLRIGWEEKVHQGSLRAVHAKWDPATRLWWLPLHLATQLALEERIAEWSPPREGISSKV